MQQTKLDCERYLAENPDVKQAGLDAQRHYQQFGCFEARPAYTTSGKALHLPKRHIKHLAKIMLRGYSKIALPELEYWISNGDVAEQWLAGAALCQWYYRQADFTKVFNIFNALPKAVQDLPQYQQFAARLCARFPLQKAHLTHYLTALPDYQWVANCNKAVHQQDHVAWLSALNSQYQHAGLSCLAWQNAEKGLDLTSLSAKPLITEPKTANKQPLVSVIVPVYNAADSIEMVLTSLLNQSWPNTEIIVVDDASTDNTVQKVLSFTHIAPNLRVIKSSTNGGAYHARNLGLKAAKGDFVTVNDGDDWAHPDKLKVQAEALVSSVSLMCTLSCWVRISADCAIIGSWLLDRPFVEENHSSAMFRRSVFARLGPWDEVKFAADAEFLRRLTAHYGAEASKIVFDRIPLALSLIREDALTQMGASHVSTIDFGVRWAYRQLANYWHKQPGEKYFNPQLRPFSLPASMDSASSQKIDLVLIADLSCEQNSEPLSAWLLSQTQYRYKAVLHWPDPTAENANQLSVIWQKLCATGQIALLDTNCVLEQVVVAYTSSTIAYTPDKVPRFAKVQQRLLINAAFNSVALTTA